MQYSQVAKRSYHLIELRLLHKFDLYRQYRSIAKVIYAFRILIHENVHNVSVPFQGMSGSM